MTTDLMSPESSPASQSKARVEPSRRRSEPSVQQIIASARAHQPQAPARGAWLLASVAAALFYASFTPLDWGPLAWIALVPLVLLIRLRQRTRWMYTAITVSASVSFVALLHWMRYGDPTMVPAMVALGVYCALYVPLWVAVSRVAVHRFSVPLMVAVPVVWTGLEFLRATFGTGFAWYFLSHTQYRWIELIQISDVTGAYGVSFLIALAAACAGSLVPPAVLGKLRLLPQKTTAAEGVVHATPPRQTIGVAVCVALLAATLVYGYFRRAQADFQAGPRVALIQGNFTTSVRDYDDPQHIFLTHHRLTGMAIEPRPGHAPPELVVWPESMYRAPLLVTTPGMSDEDLRRVAPEIPVEAWRSKGVAQALADLSQQYGAGFVVGLNTFVADERGLGRYNSAAFLRPDLGLTARYDKMHRVPFGEYLPLKDYLPWLHKLTPFSPTFGIQAGRAAAVFEYGGARLAPIICFEDTVPQLVRRIVKSTADPQTGQPVDCLVNVTNDGWFHGSNELEQHLITSVFRAVETRTPMVRAVNTGISAFIDGDGVVREPDLFLDGDNKGRDSMIDPETGEYRKQQSAVLIGNIPLDDRRSLYVTWGDWLGLACLFAAGLTLVGGLIPRRARSDGREEFVREAVTIAGEAR